MTKYNLRHLDTILENIPEAAMKTVECLWTETYEWQGKEVDLDIARAITKIKRTRGGSRILGWVHPAYELGGMLAEMAYSVWRGQPMVKLPPTAKTDYGIDFLESDFSVDVKGSFNADIGLLLRWRSPYMSDIYVKAHLDPFDLCNVQLIGWTWYSYLANAPIKDYGNKGKPAHVLPVGDKYQFPMDTLIEQAEQMRRVYDELQKPQNS